MYRLFKNIICSCVVWNVMMISKQLMWYGVEGSVCDVIWGFNMALCLKALQSTVIIASLHTTKQKT